MNTEKIFDENGKGFTRIFSNDKVERVNPIEYYKNYELKKQAVLLRDLLNAEDSLLTSQLTNKFFIKNAEEILGDLFEQIENSKIKDNFIHLLNARRKKDQKKLLKGMSLNSDELMSLIFISYKDYGYLYSKYLFENLPGGLEEKKLPKFFHIKDDGTIEKVGETDLSDGELKNLIEHRKVIISHFLEKDNFWHCFFITYKSIDGKENWNNGQTHLHYISSSFGISKADFIESMRSGKYKSTSIHIDLLDYGKQIGE